MECYNEAKRQFPHMVSLRRQLHSNPELSYEEKETTALLAKELEELGIPYTLMEPTGVVGEILGAKPGKTVLLRADIDALPIEENTGLPYASRNRGVSHACGHDTHPAMLMGAAAMLNARREELCGRVKLLFQPAEEAGSGARAMIEQGVLVGVDACFAEHIFSQQPAGCVITGAGQVMAGAGTFTIRVKGEACHGGMPHTGVDALLAGARIVEALQTIVSREVSPTVPMVITVGTFHSGTRYNVVAGEATIEGTVRAFDRELLKNMGETLRRVADGVAASCRCTASTEYACTCASLLTDAAVTEVVRQAARKVVPDLRLLATCPPSMGSEDFAEFSACVPCGFAVIGGGGEHPQHSDKYTIDESAFVVGAALYAQFALDYLNG